MNSDEIAWASGLFDGEGTFYIAKTHDTKYYARMKLGMCHKEAVDRFAAIMSVGNVTCEPRPAENSNYQQFRWSTSGQNAIDCAKRLYPYLIVKRLECEVLLRWEELIANGRDKFITPENLVARENLYQDMFFARQSGLVAVEPYFKDKK